MIESQIRKQFTGANRTQWTEASKKMAYSTILLTFRTRRWKINDVIYNTANSKFKEAWQKETMWDKLND